MSSHDHCLVVDADGFAFKEFSCVVPQLSLMYLDVEKTFEPTVPLRWMQENMWFPFVAIGIYIAFIVLGPRAMESQDAWKWRNTLACWNLCLSIFSFIGMSRTIPPALYDLAHMSMRDNFCENPRYGIGGGSTGLWILLFAWSKFPELLDTFFIVIHKKPLIFLHWYHHITVLLYTWWGYTHEARIGIFMSAMNYSVHAIMYGYYFLMAMKMRPRWFNPVIITFAQIAQMFVGCAIALTAYHYYSSDPSCHLDTSTIFAGFAMYGSYLFLFVQFFVGRYLQPKVKKL